MKHEPAANAIAAMKTRAREKADAMLSKGKSHA
jgi:hypothetical protein